MKVLIITPSPPQYLGGLALFSKDLSLNLEKNGIKIDMLTSTLSKEGPIYDKIGKNINVLEQKVYLFPDNNNFLRIKNNSVCSVGTISQWTWLVDGAIVSYACIGADEHVWLDNSILANYNWSSDECALFYG